MPAALHRALAKSARKKGYKPGSKKYNAYVYGTLAKHKKGKKKK